MSVRPRASDFLSAVAVASSLAFAGWVLWWCGSGLELTDEGFYLNWIATPSAYASSVTQFGFVYHPLFQLAGGDVATVRRMNMLLSLACGWSLAFAILRVARQKARGGERNHLLDGAIALAAGTTVFAQLGVWLPTPNYNSLALQSLLLAATGFVLTRSPLFPWSLAGWVIAGAAGAFTFLAKPTSAAMLAVLALWPLLRPGASGWRGLLSALAAATLTLAVVFWVIDGSLAATLHRHTSGLEAMGLLNPSSTSGSILRLERFTWSVDDRWKSLALCAALAAGTALATLHAKAASFCRVAAVVIAVLTLAALARWVPADWYGHVNRGLWMWVIAGAGAVAATVTVRRNGTALVAQGLGMGVWLFLFPAAYSIGTTNNYWLTAGLAVCFWGMAGLAALAPAAMRLQSHFGLLLLALAAQAIAAVISAMSAQTPYRQLLPLFEQSAPIRFHEDSTLSVGPEMARYVQDLVQAAESAGFRPGTPLMDLTGRTPAAAFVLNATAAGQPWLLGGYPGSDTYAAQTLRSLPCSELARAWLLTQPGSPGHISADVLGRAGLTWDAYAAVGRFRGPAVLERSPRDQVLYKPAHAPGAIVADCTARRSAQSG